MLKSLGRALVVVSALSVLTGPAVAGERSPSPTVMRLPPPSGAVDFGGVVAGAGDVNADGIGDVLVGAPHSNHVRVVSGTGGLVRDVSAPASATLFGAALASVGDVNRDGVPDFVAGAPGAARGRAFVFSGASGEMVTELVPATIGGSGFGRSLTGAGDLSGDGVPDIVVGAPGHTVGSGVVFAFSGANGSQLWSRPAPSSGLGVLVVSSPDLSGDDIDDVLVSSPSPPGHPAVPGAGQVIDALTGVLQQVLGREEPNRVHILSGATGEVVRSIADPASTGGEAFGATMVSAGDQDGDGIVDLLIASAGANSLHLYSGRDGMLIRSVAAQADAQRQGTFALARVDDKDGDGRDDFWVGVRSARAVHLINNRGTVLASAAAPSLHGTFGAALAAVGNIGGDNGADLVVGDPAEPGGGAAYLLHIGAGSAPPARTAARQAADCLDVACAGVLRVQAQTPVPPTTVPTATTFLTTTTTQATSEAPATASLPKPGNATTAEGALPGTGGVDRSVVGLSALGMGTLGIATLRRVREPPRSPSSRHRVSVLATKPRWVASGEEGFTLVELLVAIALFGVVLTAVAGAFISSVRSVGDQRLRTAATRLASDRLETLRSVPFNQLEAQAGQTVQTIYGREFRIETSVVTMVAANGDPPPAEPVRKELKRITAAVGWTAPGGASRNVSYTTAVAADPRAAVVQQAIGVITMFPSPATTDATGQPMEPIDVTVPLQGFSVGTLVHLEWANADGTAGAKTLKSTSGVNWLGTVAKEQVRGVIGIDGLGLMEFTVSAGNLVARYTLVLQRVVSSPPTITGATIDRNPVTVAKVASGRTCDSANQCQNTTNVVFTVNTTGLDAAQDSVVLQYQLFDGTYQEVALAPRDGVSGQWRLELRSKTTKFRAGSDRVFRFTAIRSADGATAGTTFLRDVVSV